jgi:GNAT superfamily N-acetyltransferase
VQSLKFACNFQGSRLHAADTVRSERTARKGLQVGASTAKQQALTSRPATEQDTAFLCAVYRSVREPELLAMGWPEAQIEAFCEMQHRLRTAGYGQYLPPVETFLLLWQNTPVGMLAVCRDPERWVLVSIELLPAARSKGIGTETIARLQQEARAAGVGLRLQASSGSPALRLYERCGFACVASDGAVQRMEWPHGKSRISRKPGKNDESPKTVD